MKRQNNTKKIIPIAIIATLFVISLSMATAAPTVELNPAQPKPQESVTFTATIPDEDNIQQVTIQVQECGNEPDIGYICYTDEFNESMTETAENTYSATINLAHENAIEIKYQLHYQTDEGWNSYPAELTKVDLDISDQNNDDTSGNGDDSSTDTPGFETLALFISVIFISLILYRRKR